MKSYGLLPFEFSLFFFWQKCSNNFFSVDFFFTQVRPSTSYNHNRSPSTANRPSTSGISGRETHCRNDRRSTTHFSSKYTVLYCVVTHVISFKQFSQVRRNTLVTDLSQLTRVSHDVEDVTRMTQGVFIQKAFQQIASFLHLFRLWCDLSII